MAQAIPDAAALVFACLGIALALHGRLALRARALNLASVAASVFMNAIAAAPGWRNLAIWILPPACTAWTAPATSATSSTPNPCCAAWSRTTPAPSSRPKNVAWPTS